MAMPISDLQQEIFAGMGGDGDLYLTWDADYSEGKDQPRTVIGDQVLFSEPASWEAIGFPGDGSNRYEGICKARMGFGGEKVLAQ